MLMETRGGFTSLLSGKTANLIVKEISFFGHRWTQIVKILKLQNNNVICVYLRKSVSYLT
jgi:hypothetical protein